MTDQEIVNGLIDRDNYITEEFFFNRCRPLFCSIIKKVFDYKADYDEIVNEIYYYLMKDDAAKLRSFEFRSSLYHWLKILAIRRCLEIRIQVIDDNSDEPPYEQTEDEMESEVDSSADSDLQRLFDLMPNKRYVYVIQSLIIEDKDPEDLAKEMNITTANLYNIKKRAMAQLTRVALNDIKEYGK